VIPRDSWRGGGGGVVRRQSQKWLLKLEMSGCPRGMGQEVVGRTDGRKGTQ
jgi:hypothetical protein